MSGLSVRMIPWGRPCVVARPSSLIAAAPVTVGHTHQARRSHAAEPYSGTLREIDGGRLPCGGAEQNRGYDPASRSTPADVAEWQTLQT